MSPEREMPDPLPDVVCHACRAAVWREPRGVAGAAWQGGNPLTPGLFAWQAWRPPRPDLAGHRRSPPPLPRRAARTWQSTPRATP